MVTVESRHDAPDGWYRDPRYVYIGRPGPFGNPFPARNLPGQRDKSIAAYAAWLLWKLGSDSLFRETVDAIPEDAVLLCWCKPLACHGDVLAEYLNARLGSSVVELRTHKP